MHPRRSLGGPRSICPITTCVILFVAQLLGCGTTPIPGADNSSRSRPEEESGEVLPVQSPVIEDGLENSIFGDAQPATLPLNDEILIEGVIDAAGDVDIYALGPAVAGDRIIVDVTGHNGLNTVAAIFDGANDLIDANDDRSYYAGVLDPFIAQVLRSDTSNLYLGIAVSTASYFASSEGRYETGTYTVRVRRETNAPVRLAAHQLVYLDFEGGDRVQIGLEPIEVMRPFSAESISGRLEGRTDYLIGLILDHVRHDYAAFNVTLLDSRHHAVPTEAHTKLYFGNYSERFLGLADNVDTGNVYSEQEAIIYAEDLAMFERLLPSAEEVAQALANIAAHELGHLLGLEHSAEAADVMSTAATARQILEMDGELLRTRLENTVFPVGYQNGPNLLVLNVGSNPFWSSNARLRFVDILPRSAPSFRDEMEDIPIVQCNRCNKHCGGH